MEKIEVNIRTNSKYGLVNPKDVLEVGKDIDETGATRWVENGIAKPVGLKKTRKPTSDNTVKEIKAYLEDQEIEFDSTLKKAELLELVDEN